MMSAEAKQKLESGKAASSVPFFYSLNAQAHPQGIGERSGLFLVGCSAWFGSVYDRPKLFKQVES
jgi:hypothetical protein